MITDLATISALANSREAENDAFVQFIRQQDAGNTDAQVHALNEQVSARVDCTQCGNCCRSLIIHINKEEINTLSGHLQLQPEVFTEKFVEQSQGGQLFISSMPCHFLENNSCTVYEHRFGECRNFPHLHLPGFTTRIFTLLSYYGTCPIIFNVMEALKKSTGFFNQ